MGIFKMILFNVKKKYTDKKLFNFFKFLPAKTKSIVHKNYLDLIKSKIFLITVKKTLTFNKKLQQRLLQSNYSNPILTYNFIIKNSGSNIFINVYDVTKKKTVKIATLGSHKLKKKTDKTAKKYFLLQLLSNSIIKLKKFKPVSVHFLGVNLMFNRFILNILKKNFIVQTIKIYNLIPHNGCR